MAELLERRDAVHGADLVELRLDGIRDLDVAGALAGRRLPVIATCRAARQGGRFDGAEETRLRFLDQAWDLGAEYVDVESDAADALLSRSGGRRIVRSHHDFVDGTRDAADRLRTLLASGAEIGKIAVTVDRLAQLPSLAALGRSAGGRAVVLAMGGAGLASRVLAGRFASRWTYAGDGVAPGQVPLAVMRDMYRVPAIGAATRVFGVIGRPVMHSLSPLMHNAAFAAAGVDAVYLPLAAADFADFTAFAAAFGVEGVSVTAPYKPAALAAAVSADPIATRVGAANTLRRTAAGWEACNTDVAGVLAPLAGRDLRGVRVSVLGAGGAARGVAVAFADAGARVAVHARRAEAAATLAAAVGASAGPWPPPPDAWDVLVNTTPVGTTPAVDATPVVLDGRLDGRLVYDLVYNPRETALLRQARHLGATTLDGLPMLAAQAALQFTWWTGSAAPASAMQQAAAAALPGSPLPVTQGP